jgi:hypothetical protein
MPDDPKRLFDSMFDLSFTHFITTRLIKIIYLICIVLSVISGMAMLVFGISRGIWAGILAFILAPLAVMLEIMIVRVILEIVVVLFRIEADIDKISKQ